MTTILEGTALAQDISCVRNGTTPTPSFRAAVRRIGLHLASEVSRHLPARTIDVSTPLETTSGTMIDGTVVLVPVLRAGLGLLDPFLDILPDAAVGYVGLKRDEDTLEAHRYYTNLPPLDSNSIVIVLDPMLATGGTMCATLDLLKDIPHKATFVASIIAAPEGIAAVTARHTDVHVVVAQLDRCLNASGFIMPGLGDAGDRLFGT